MEKPLAQTELGSGVALDQGQHLAHTAVVCRELIIELAQDSADMRGVVDERHPVSGFGQIQGGTNPADSRSNDECISDFFIHAISSGTACQRMYGLAIRLRANWIYSIPTTSAYSSSRNSDNGGFSSRLLPAS